jgi:hyperosmotically inducible protein
MLRQIQRILTGMAMSILMLSLAEICMASIPKGTAASPSGRQPTDLQDKVRHSLLMLSTYGVFDELSFSIEGDTVTLTGEVRRPIVKLDAEWAVRNIAGVAKVVNNIEILPLSSMDDSLREMTYRAIFSRPGFEKYAIQAVTPIRIIVKNGNITLFGVVATQLDRTMAGMAARGVPFAFSVTNNLTIG